MISKSYNFVDGQIMNGVNLGVRVWNWTTGRTKKDLASGLLTVAPILECSGTMHVNPVFGLVFCPAYLFMSHMCKKNNEYLEIEEKQAMNKGVMLNPDNEYGAQNYVIGPMWGIHSVVQLSISEIGNVTMGLGYLTRSASHYIMRADYLPPKKSVFRRAKDKLEKMIKDYNSVLEGNPSPQPAYVYRNSLESYLE